MQYRPLIVPADSEWIIIYVRIYESLNPYCPLSFMKHTFKFHFCHKYLSFYKCSNALIQINDPMNIPIGLYNFPFVFTPLLITVLPPPPLFDTVLSNVSTSTRQACDGWIDVFIIYWFLYYYSLLVWKNDLKCIKTNNFQRKYDISIHPFYKYHNWKSINIVMLLAWFPYMTHSKTF